MDEVTARAENNIERLRTDAVAAEETRAELRPLLEKIAAVMERAKRDGLIVSFTIGPDQFNRHGLRDISIVKPL